jgi:hypothetical protein
MELMRDLSVRSPDQRRIWYRELAADTRPRMDRLGKNLASLGLEVETHIDSESFS